jgi:signal transduction histidine kinase/DNA-binding NarL/FixJ family response regulator
MSEDAEDDCLAGGGEAGALMRAIDWSGNPLGRVRDWPLTLRNTVSIMLASRFAMRVLWGPEMTLLYNDAYQPVLGARKHPSAMGSRTEDVYRELWHVVGPMFRRVYAGEAIALDDGILPLDRSGYLEECFFTLSYSPLRDDAGKINGVLGVVHETTERVLAERRLLALRELAGSAGTAKTPRETCELAAQSLAQHSTDVPFSLFFLMDDDGRRAHRVAAFGLPEGAAASPPIIDLGDATSETGWPLAAVAAARRSQSVPHLGRRFGILHAGPYPEAIRDGYVVPLMRRGQDRLYGFWIVGLNPRHALDDKYEGFFELAAEHIVGAIGNAAAFQEERLRAEGLLEIDRQKTAFFHNVSHEFRTPLTLILGPVSDAVASPGRALTGPNLISVERNALRLLKLVNALLEFSRIEAGRVQATYRPTDLPTLTRELASAFQSLAERAGLTLTIDCAPLGEPIYVDQDMWEKIVLNLLSNAFKFTFEGGIRVSLTRQADGVALQIADSGVGIPSAELPHLFDRFHRVEGTRARTHEGTGIGLALVQELTKLHGGLVSVESQEGKGTAFVVTIPAGNRHLPTGRLAGGTVDGTTDRTHDRSSALRSASFVEEASTWLSTSPGAPDHAASFDGAAEGLSAAARGARVLLADDNADMRAYVRSILAPHFLVDEATDGRAALELALRRAPDLVLSDVMMPNLDGFGLLRELRNDVRTRGVPVILLSAQAGEESRVEGLETGADDYLIKPFSGRELVARVRTHIELGRLRARLEAERRRLAEEERARLYSFLMQMPASICILRGPDHIYELANPAYLRLIGDRDILNQPLRQALPEVAPTVVPLLDRVYQTGEPFFGNEFPIPIEREGRVEAGFFNFVYKPIAGAGGELDRIAVVAFEVTPQVAARREAERLSRALAISNRDLDQFAYVASHDLKAPLRGIASLSQWIEEGLGDKMDAESRSHLDLLRRRVQRLEALIDGILEYARAGRARTAAESVDVSALLVETRDLLSARPEAQIVIGDGMPSLRTERTLLQQVFLNLMGNALKHAGRADVTIQVTCENDGGPFFHFKVADDGPGIPPQYHERIWGLFTTLESRDKVEGSGIGLSVVKKIVESRGGRVTVESESGCGSVFHVFWPKGLAVEPG